MVKQAEEIFYGQAIRLSRRRKVEDGVVLEWMFLSHFLAFFKVIAITFWSKLWRFSEKKQSYADFVKISVTYLKLEIAKIDLR
jgi:hypothetical protein